jgi:hypothetical protein
MILPTLHLYRFSINRVEYVLDFDAERARARLESEAPFTPEDLEVEEVTMENVIEEEVVDTLPIHDETLLAEVPTAEVVVKSLHESLKIRAALEQPSDFPRVPELELTDMGLMEAIEGLVHAPKSVDWKLKGYLFLKYPKLKDAVLEMHEAIKRTDDQYHVDYPDSSAAS